MSIHNGIGFAAYQRTMDARIAGTPAESRLPVCRPAVNPLPRQVSNIAIGTFDTDTDSITITVREPDGTLHSVTVTRAAGVPVDADAAATAFADAFNALPAFKGVGVATTSTSNVILTFDHAGIEYTVSATASAGTTATVTLTTDPAGVSIPLARFVKRDGAAPDGGTKMALPTAAADLIWGILMRPLGQFVNGESPLSSAVDEVPPGRMADVAYEGAVNMELAGADDVDAGDPVYCVVDTDAGELGQAHSGPAGVAELWTVTPTAAELDFAILVEWTRPDGHTESIPLLSANPDGSATATEICDAWRTAAAAAQADGALAGFTFGGTTTLTITGPAGQSFRVIDVGEGIAAAVETTPSDVRTVKVPGAYWIEAVAAGEVGPVMLRM